jgi:hypothetical protein
MPVLQSPRPEQVQPAAQESALPQPASVADPVKVAAAEINIAKYKKRVKCTSYCLMTVGAIGMIASLYSQFTARHTINRVANEQPPSQHGHHGKQGEHTQPPHPQEKPTPEQYVTKDQFDLYDTIKTLSWITFFIFAKIMAIGKCGKFIVWGKTSGWTHRISKKSCCAIFLVIIVSFFAYGQINHMDMLISKIHKSNADKLAVKPPTEDRLLDSVDPMTFDLDGVIDMSPQIEPEMEDEPSEASEEGPIPAERPQERGFEHHGFNGEHHGEHHGEHGEHGREHGENGEHGREHGDHGRQGEHGEHGRHGEHD